MSKKDFVIMANILKETRGYLDTEGIEMLKESFIEAFENNYPRFDKNIFEEYLKTR